MLVWQMANKRAKKDPVDDWEDDPMSAELPEGDSASVVRTAEGRAVILPWAVRNLRGQALEACAVLERIAIQNQEGRERQGLAVVQAREHGVSWDTIGWMVGTTGDAARKRYSDLENEVVESSARRLRGQS